MTSLDALRAFSARIGADPLLVQAAGGNTSLKAGGVLHIKASGTWLARALDEDIFVPVRLAPLLAAIAAGDPAAATGADFVLAGANPRGLRPSIETTLHAVMPQAAVVHVHCVETIATAVRADALAVLEGALAGLDWIHVPYDQPGLPLARAIAAARRPGTDVVILGNHGLVTAAQTLAGAEALMHAVGARLARPTRPAPAPDAAALAAAALGSGYHPAPPGVHAIALDPVALDHARAGSLYPDHVIFLGPGINEARAGEGLALAARRLGDPVMLVAPGLGVFLRDDASAGAAPLAACLADVTTRIETGAPLRVLTAAEDSALLNWDAEKYRQSLNRRT